MGNFNRDRGGRGGFGGGRDRGGDRGGRRDGGQLEMHDAVCYECGKDCQVPFRPTGDKPVYCSNCFGKKEEGGRNDRYERRGNDRQEKRMFEAVCDECGKDCEVPFKPSPDKPVYCSECFEQQDRPRRDEQPRRNENRSSAAPSNDQFKKQFEALANKMDSIIELLSAQAPAKKAVKEDKVNGEAREGALGQKPAVKVEKKEVKEKVEVKKEAAPKKEVKKVEKKVEKKVAPKKVAKKEAAPKKVAPKKAVKKVAAKKK